MFETPLNPARVEEAMRDVRRLLERAERGDQAARASILRAAVADDLESKLRSIVAHAGKCAPTLEEIRICGNQYGYEAQLLRFEIGHAEQILNKAAGRATVTSISSAASPQHVTEREGADHSHDNGEFPRAPLGAA